MAEPDDIDKLLREIDAMNLPASRPGASPAPAAGPTALTRNEAASSGRRGVWAGISAVGGFVVGGGVGTVLAFLPSVGPLQTAIGAAVGGVVVGVVSGPPTWFRGRG